MADLNISLGFDVETASIRRVQSEITRALKDVTPEITFDVRRGATRASRAIADELASITIESIRVDASALNEIRNTIQREVDIEIQDIFPAERALRDLRRKLQDALEDLEISTQLQTRAGPGIQGPSKEEAAAIREQAKKRAEGRELSTDPSALKEQRKKSLEKVIDAEAQLELAERTLAGQAEFLTRKLGDIAGGVELDSDLRSLKRSLKEAQRVKILGVTADEAIRLSGVQSDLIQNLQARINVQTQAAATTSRLIEAERAAAATIAAAEADQKQVSAEFRKYASTLGSLNAISQNLPTDVAGLQRSLREAQRISTVGAGLGENGRRELDALQAELIANIQRRINAAQQAAATSSRLANITSETEASQRTLVDAYNANARTQQAEINASQQNFRAIERVRSIAEQLANAEIKAADAFNQLSRIRINDQAALAEIALREWAAAVGAASNVTEALSAAEAATEIAFREFEQEARETAAAERQSRSQRLAQLRTTLRAGRQNARALETINKIGASLNIAGTDLVKALGKAEDISIIGAESGIGRQVAQAQSELVVQIRELIANYEAAGLDLKVGSGVEAAQKAIDRAAKDYEFTLSLLQKEADANTASLEKLNRLQDEYGRDLAGLNSALKQARKIEGIGDSDLSESVNEIKNVFVQRLEAERTGLQLAKDAKELRDKANERLRAEANQLKRILKSQQDRFGITDKTLSISQNIFDELSSEAKVIVDGRKKTRSAFEILFNKIVSGAKNLIPSGPSGGGGPSGPTPPGGDPPDGGGTVTIRNAGDIEQFARLLGTEQLAAFTDKLGQLTGNLNTAHSAIKRTAKQQGDLVSALKRGESAAGKFGAKVREAAVRLAAWATPANLIFATISRLRRAVNEIIEIDRQARRLVFFTNAGQVITQSTDAIKEFSEQVEGVKADALFDLAVAYDKGAASIGDLVDITKEFDVTNKNITRQFSSITKLATAYGLSIRSVTNALLEVTRVGQEATGAFRGGSSAFLDAALSLVRVEAGALRAGEAVRGLQAIQAQFFGGRAGTIFKDLAKDLDATAASAQAVSTAAAILATTSAGSSASVSELIDATTRLGSAFTQLAGLNFPQTIAILGDAFTATGATTGRLATALRQTATLITQNAASIADLTALTKDGIIDVTDEAGTVRGFEAILDVLTRIRNTAGTLASTELSLLIADRRNVADIQALAQNVDKLRDSFKRFNDPVERTFRAADAAIRLFRQTTAAANSLEGQIQNLETAFTELVNSEGIRELGSTAVKFATLLVGAFDKLLSVVGKVASALPTVGAVIAGLFLRKVVQSAIQFGKGILAGNSALSTQADVLGRINLELGKRQNIGSNIQALQSAGLLSAEQARRAQLGIVGSIAQEQSVRDRLSATISAVKVLEEDRENNQQEINFLLQRQIDLTNNLKDAQRGVNREVQKTAAAADIAREKAEKGQRLSKGVGIGLAVLGLGVQGAQATGQKEIGNILEGALTGASAGIAAGPAVAIGAAIGGAIVAGIAEAFGTGTRELAEIEKAVGPSVATVSKFLSQAALTERAVSQVSERADVDQTKRLNKSLKIIKVLRGEIKDLGGRQVLIDKERANDLSEYEKEQLVGLRAAINEQQALVAEVTAEIKNRENAVKQNKVAAGILKENERLQSIINDKESDAATKAAAIVKLEKNRERLKSDIFDKTEAIAQAEERSLVAEQRRLIVAERLERQFEKAATALSLQRALSEALTNIPRSQRESLELAVSLDEANFNATIKEAEAKIRQLEVASKEDKNNLELQKKIADEEKKVTEARIKRISSLISGQKRILDDANRATTQQIRAWEKASDSVTKAFANVVNQQKNLANIFKRIGTEFGAIIDRTNKNLSAGLEAAGVSFSARFNAITNAAGRELENVRATFARQQSTLGERFGSGADISSSVQTLIEAAANVISKSDEEIANRRRGVVTTEASRARQLARDARAQFDLRISETRREIDIRRNLLTEEIRILQRKDAEERKLFELRRKQQEDAGRLLIESPEEFKKQLQTIGTAESFFKGITDLTTQGIATIQRRAEGLRGTGRGQDVLRQVLQGIDAAVRTGSGDLISGIGNRELQQIFLRAQREGASDISRDLQRQRDEANSQTQIQREIDARQKALVALSEFDVEIQRNLLALAQADAQNATLQRDRMTAELSVIAAQGKEQARIFQSGLKSIIGVLSFQLDPSEIDAQSSEFAKRIGNVLQGLAPDLAEVRRGGGGAGGDVFRAAAKDIQKSFQSFLVEDFNQSRQAKQKREELNSTIDAQTAKVRDEIKVVNDFIVKMKGATIAVGEHIEATKKQTGAGLENVEQQEAAKRASLLRDQLRGNSSQNLNRFISAEIEQIKKRTENGGQLTRAERNRLRELERFSRRGFRNDPRGGRQIARRLLRDDQLQGQVVEDFRRTLADTAANQNEFIDRARRLRGEGARGRRDIKVAEVQRFLQGAGFTGAAERISTKGQAANILDRFIEISERLAKEQDTISRETKKKIIQVLGDELVTGVRGITHDAADAVASAAVEATKGITDNGGAEKIVQSMVKAAEVVTVKAFNEEAQDKITQAIANGGILVGQNLAETLTMATQALAETKITVDDVQLKAEVAGKINVAVESDIGTLIRDALLPVIGNNEQLTKTVENIKNALLRANFPGVRPVPEGDR